MAGLMQHGSAVAIGPPGSAAERTGRTAPPDVGTESLRALLHDLRQPLTAINLLTGLPGAGPARIQSILTHAEWLTALVDAATDAVGEGRVTLDAASLVRQHVDRHRSRFLGVIDTELPATMPALAPDHALRRTLDCLLTNAVRSCRARHLAGGRIRVTGSVDSGQATVLITDNGQPPGTVPAENGRTLAIARTLAVGFGGSLQMSRRRGATGMVARLRLPGPPAEPASELMVAHG